MTAVAGGARHDPRILTAGMQGRRGCLQAFRGPRRRSPGVLTTTAHPATTNPLSLSLPLSEHSTSTRRGRYEFPDALFPPPPLLNKANKCTLWLFFFLFTRCRRCCSVLREGRKEGSGGQVFPANGLKTEPRGNRGFWLLVGTAVVAILDIGCFLPGREWMGLDLGRFVLGMMRCVCVCMCVYICYLILEKKKEGFSSFQVYNKIEHKIYRILISS